MNIFRNLIGKVWQDSEASEVVKISTGQLYLIRAGTIRSDRECIYNDAMATIRRVPSIEHNFQLVITRVYEEGDEELFEGDDETDEERSFLISQELEFRTSEHDGEPTFIWRDMQGGADELYEFEATGTNAATRALFETCMYRAMYERKYKKSAEGTSDADMAEFMYSESPKAKTKGKKKKATSKDDSLSAAMENLTVDPESEPSPSAPPPASNTNSTPIVGSEIADETATLWYWDIESGQFLPQLDGAEVSAKVIQPRPGALSYCLCAVDGEGNAILAHEMVPDMMVRWAAQIQALTWSHMSDGRMTCWCFRFANAEAYESFKMQFIVRMWETVHQLPWEKAKADEQIYFQESIVEDVEMKDVEDEDEEEDEDAVADELEEEEEEDEGPGDSDAPKMPAGRNSQLTVGYKGDRSYVLRGNSIGVFNRTSDHNVGYYGTISNLTDTKGKSFNPSHVMLHEQDSKMVVMNPNDPNSLYELDLERGKIVEQWHVDENVTVNAIAPDNKLAQTTPEQTIVGTSHNALFRIDPRVSGSKLVDSQFKQYVSKNKFSGVTTTASGKLAVASEKGDIRLFDTIGKNAKTALHPLGDPIIGIDVTADGRWIVATTKTYLLLIDTLIGQGKYAGQLGFDRSFPADAKPQPRRLQLRGEHVAYMNHEVSFTPARFNIGDGQTENAIVTSTGQFVIAWDFAKVKKGQMDKYEIKKYEDLVVQDNFRFGDDKEIIVALQNDVLSVNKKALKRPTRASLAPPPTDSRSGIVNSPY